MAKVLLGDVVDHVKDKVDKDSTDLEFYVGGEHIDGDEITVRRRGHIEGSTIGPAFHTRFQQGDVLLMSRNPHLRKASMVDFDGICSDVSYVCRTKDNNVLLQSLLPFILQTPEFWQFAEENKKGGLPFFLNWKDFARFEFELIPIDRQQQISNLLWAMERTKNAYRELIAKTDELVKSQFVEMFGEPINNTKGLPVHQLSEYISFLTSGSRGWAKYHSDEGEWFITIKNVKDCKISLDGVQCITPPQNAEADRTRLKDGDLLISITADLGRTGVVTKEIADHGAYINQHLTCIRIDRTVLNPLYVAYFMESEAGKKQFFEKNLSSVKAGLNFDSIRTLQLLVPSMVDQERFIAFVEQSDKSKFEAQQTLKELTDAQKALMKKIFEQ
ncbi:MAG: restriction endonuclease subunit S [Acidaminococcaceae bacterium]|nr:restriction endonuclease subunit S [Acidaminococcaceae bacterium]